MEKVKTWQFGEGSANVFEEENLYELAKFIVDCCDIEGEYLYSSADEYISLCNRIVKHMKNMPDDSNSWILGEKISCILREVKEGVLMY